MVSTPKQTTTKVEPWDGAKPYIEKYLGKADQLFEAGAPLPWQGDLIAKQSQASVDSLNGAENLARNGDTSALTNATNTVNSVMNANGNTQANNTLSQLQYGTNLGSNPTNNIAAMIATGQTAQAPGTYDQNYTNSAINSINGMQNYTNGALGQAQNLNGYQNAAMGMQQQQANNLANGQNTALGYLQNTASGANIGNNPYLNQMVSQQQDKIAQKLANVTNPALASQAAALGRSGSAAFANQLNNAQSAAANEMAKVATDMYGNQYNQDVSNQLNAANQYGALVNQDVTNRLNANQALAQTSDSQQAQRLAGTQLYGNLSDAQAQQRLAAANSLGAMNDNQANQRLNAANSANQQFNANRAYQMQGLEMLGNNYQNNITNMLASNDQRMNAANAQINGNNATNNQRLQAAGMAKDAYTNQYLPYEQLGQIGQARDDRSALDLQAQINKWDTAQQQQIQNISNMLNMANGGNYSNTTQPVYSSSGAQVLGGLTSLLGLFMSDIRSKTILAYLGITPNGIPMYQFTYNNDPEQYVYVGPIAQEMAEIKPDSVIDIDGTLYVDSDALFEEVA